MLTGLVSALFCRRLAPPGTLMSAVGSTPWDAQIKLRPAHTCGRIIKIAVKI